MVDSMFSVDAGRRTGRVGRRERSQRRLGKPWARVIVTPSVAWARSCAALDMESIIVSGAGLGQLCGELLNEAPLLVIVQLAELVSQGALVDLLVPPVDRVGAEQRPAPDDLLRHLVGGGHHPACLGVAD